MSVIYNSETKLDTKRFFYVLCFTRSSEGHWEWRFAYYTVHKRMNFSNIHFLIYSYVVGRISSVIRSFGYGSWRLKIRRFSWNVSMASALQSNKTSPQLLTNSTTHILRNVSRSYYRVSLCLFLRLVCIEWFLDINAYNTGQCLTPKQLRYQKSTFWVRSWNLMSHNFFIQNWFSDKICWVGSQIKSRLHQKYYISIQDCVKIWHAFWWKQFLL